MALKESDVKFLRSNGGIHPRLIELFERVSEREDLPYPFQIARPYGGRRTAKMQRKLFNGKKSKKDGYKRKSRHQSGCAIDIVALVDGKPEWNSRDVYRKMTKVIKSEAKDMGLKMRHGSDWKWFDGFHHEISSKQVKRYIPWQSSSQNPILQYNCRYLAVSKFQELMNELGYKLTVDGHYGNSCIKSLKDFQKKEGIEIDGICGPATWKELREAVKDIKR